MKKLIPLFIVLAAGIASAEWKLNPYTQRQDYYESKAGIAASISALDADKVNRAGGTLTGPLTTSSSMTATLGFVGDLIGNAATVTNGVYTTGSYANPDWITSLATSKIDLSTVTTALAGKQATGNYITSLTGNVTASGPGAAAATIVSVPQAAVNLSTVTTALAGKLDTGGNAATATALAADPTDCTGVNFARGVNASGTAACAQPSDVTGNAATATKLLNARTINGVSFDGSANINIATTSYLADGVSLALTGATFSAKSSSVTLQGNTFNGASQLVKLDALSKLPAVDGSQLTNLPSTSGGAVLTATQTFTGANTFSSSLTASSFTVLSTATFSQGYRINCPSWATDLTVGGRQLGCVETAEHGSAGWAAAAQACASLGARLLSPSEMVIAFSNLSLTDEFDDYEWVDDVGINNYARALDYGFGTGYRFLDLAEDVARAYRCFIPR